MNDKTKLKILTVIILILLAICGFLIYKIITTSTCNAAGLSGQALKEISMNVSGCDYSDLQGMM